MFKQFGVGLAAAILIDATIVRGVLLPATMKLGEWNWYLPRWLEWLPRFEPGEPSRSALLGILYIGMLGSAILGVRWRSR
jgi:RND superfamily putative drug exporter